jgi:hypothetical protein
MFRILTTIFLIIFCALLEARTISEFLEPAQFDNPRLGFERGTFHGQANGNNNISLYLNKTQYQQDLPESSTRLQSYSRPNALWAQLSLGAASATIKDNKFYSTFIAGALSIHYRRYSKVFAVGAETAGMETWSGYSIWTTLAYSKNSKWIDSYIGGGFGYSGWSHNTESELGTIHSPAELGVILKAQILFHLPHLFGFGFGVTHHHSKNVIFSSFMFSFAVGSWNW